MDDALDPSDQIGSEKNQKRLIRYLLDANAALESRFDGLVSAVAGPRLIAQQSLKVAGDTLTLEFEPAENMWLYADLIPSGAINARLTFNSDVGTNYSYAHSINYTGQTPGVNQAVIILRGSSAASFTSIKGHITNIGNQRKIIHAWSDDDNGAGPASSLNTLEIAGKWNNFATQINRIDITNTGVGSYEIGSKARLYSLPESF
jgi:hypothetical protein